MKNSLSVLSLLLVAAVSLVSPLAAQAITDAKDMFYQELKSPEKDAGASVAYCLELHRGDAPPVLCNNRFSFKSGDGVRLHIKSTSPAYAYIALVGSTGKKSILYPPPGWGTEDNKLESGKEYVVPPHGMIVFDDHPGTERLLVVLARQPLDMTRELETGGVTINGDFLTGLPQQVGAYSVVSNDSYYELGEKTSGSGLVFVNNPDAVAKPTTIALALTHGSGGDVQNASPAVEPAVTGGASGGGAAAAGTIKVHYYVQSLHNDGNPQLSDRDEVVRSLKKLPPGQGKSGLNCGSRDQYVAGLNHMYANWCDQQLDAASFYRPAPQGKLYYSQEVQDLRHDDTGERVRASSFQGEAMPDPGRPDCSPGPTASIPGITFIEQSLSNGKPNFAIGKINAPQGLPQELRRDYLVANGHDLDAAWDANKGEPLIIAVECQSRMFQPSGPGGHVVVLSERRDMPAGQNGRTSNHEYRLLNSWGNDDNGQPRNGWVSADAAASAMNYTNDANDESMPPHRGLEVDSLPAGTSNAFARGDDGLRLDFSADRAWSKDFSFSESRTMIEGEDADVRDIDAADSERRLTNFNGQVATLKKHIASPQEGFDAEQKAAIEGALKAIAGNKDTEGKPRRFPLTNRQKAAIVEQANRMFDRSKQIYAQGLDQGDRNRALVFMLHDTADPEHINQGGHNTCNVTTIMKIETFLRPAAQVKRFVDMYCNANGDQTVTLPCF
jgi:hypothetical protein